MEWREGLFVLGEGGRLYMFPVWQETVCAPEGLQSPLVGFSLDPVMFKIEAARTLVGASACFFVKVCLHEV